MKRTTNEKGTALIETAITLPIVLLICVGIFEFGRAYQTWEVLTNSAREGARIAILQGTSSSDIETRVTQYLRDGAVLTPTQSLADVGAQVVINQNVALTASSTASQVEVDLPFQFIVLNPVVRLINGSDTTTGAPIVMRARAVMRNE